MFEFDNIHRDRQIPIDNSEVKRYVGGGSSTEKTRFVTREIAGGRFRPETRDLFDRILGMVDKPLSSTARGAEDLILDTLLAKKGGSLASRGLTGALPSSAAFASAIAPAQFEFQRGREERALQERGANIQALLESIGLALPQVVGGQEGTRRSREFSISPFGG